MAMLMQLVGSGAAGILAAPFILVGLYCVASARCGAIGRRPGLTQHSTPPFAASCGTAVRPGPSLTCPTDRPRPPGPSG